ncbi:MAG: CopG family transcriptional regulator [bacterium]
MKKKIKYTNEPLGKLKIVDDFLPPPSELIFKEETVKVTISLSKSSIEFFKQEAKDHHTQYQKMIRNLLDRYAAHYRDKVPSTGSSKRQKHNAA